MNNFYMSSVALSVFPLVMCLINDISFTYGCIVCWKAAIRENKKMCLVQT